MNRIKQCIRQANTVRILGIVSTRLAESVASGAYPWLWWIGERFNKHTEQYHNDLALLWVHHGLDRHFQQDVAIALAKHWILPLTGKQIDDFDDRLQQIANRQAKASINFHLSFGGHLSSSPPLNVLMGELSQELSGCWLES